MEFLVLGMYVWMWLKEPEPHQVNESNKSEEVSNAKAINKCIVDYGINVCTSDDRKFN